MTDFPIRVIIQPDNAKRGASQVDRSLKGLETSADRLRKTIGKTFAPVRLVVERRQLDDTFKRLRNVNSEVQKLRKVRLFDASATIVQLKEVSRQVEKLRRTSLFDSAPAIVQLKSVGSQVEALRRSTAKAFLPLRLQIERSQLDSAAITIKGVANQVDRLRRLRVPDPVPSRSVRLLNQAQAAAKGAANQVQRLGARAANAKLEFGGLQGAIQGVIAAAGVGAIVRSARDFERLERRIRSVSANAVDAERNLDLIRQVSDETGSSLRENASIFARLSIATRSLGIGSERTAGVVKTLNQALVIGGASAQEASSAITQLSQGLSSGRLQGDELRSILESAPLLAEQLAEQLGVTIGELRELGAAGDLTSDRLVAALEGAAGSIDARFRDLGPTFDQSLQRLSNSFLDLGQSFGPFLDSLSQSLALVTDLAKGVNDLLGGFNRAGGVDAKSDAQSREFNRSITEKLTLGFVNGGGTDIVSESAQDRRSEAERSRGSTLRVGNALGISGGELAPGIEGPLQEGAGIENLNAQLGELEGRLQAAGLRSIDIEQLANRMTQMGLSGAEARAEVEKLIGPIDQASSASTELAASTESYVTAAGSAVEAAAQQAAAEIQVEVAARRSSRALAEQIRALQTEAQVIGTVGTQREVLEQRLRAEESLRKAGIDATTAQSQALLGEVEALALANAQARRRIELLDEAKTPQEELAAQIAEITALYANGTLSEAEFLRLFTLIQKKAAEGIDPTGFAAFVEKLEEAAKKAENLSAIMGDAFLNSITQASNAIADLAVEGELSLDNLGQALSDI